VVDPTDRSAGPTLGPIFTFPWRAAETNVFELGSTNSGDGYFTSTRRGPTATTGRTGDRTRAPCATIIADWCVTSIALFQRELAAQAGAGPSAGIDDRCS
jgi:hypothetical protein